MKKIFFMLLFIVMVLGGYAFWYIYSGLLFLPPHYHANFAMYIDGEGVDFSDDKYMEDVAGCSLSGEKMPKDRVHLHENNGDTIHIHSEWAAWGHFFANNNYYFSSERIITDTWEEYSVDQENKIYYVLNGKEINNPYNRLISSEDRLLIAYGDYTQEELTELSDSVSDNAGEYNSKYDPGSCGGTNENGIIVLFRDMLDFHGHQH